MAQKKVLQKVKNVSGYDILNPMTPWQVQNCLFDPTSTSSLFKLETVMPAENLDDKCLAIFTPTMSSAANCQIYINDVDFGNIKWNGQNLLSEAIPAEQICVLLVDFVNLIASVQTPTGMLNIPGWNAKASTSTYTAILTSTWSGSGPWTQTVSVPGIVSNDNPIADVILSPDTETAKLEVAGWGMVSQVTTGNGNITATCLDSMPAVAITIQLKVVR